jgi:hypothetical protein
MLPNRGIVPLEYPSEPLRGMDDKFVAGRCILVLILHPFAVTVLLSTSTKEGTLVLLDQLQG